MVMIGDMGKLYGFCFQPERFTRPDAGVSGTTIWYPGGGPSDPFIEYPWFDTLDEAIQFIKDEGFYGRVLRYAKNEKGEKSWVTAGVMAIVNVPEHHLHCSPGGNHEDIQVIHADGTKDERAGKYLASLSKLTWGMKDPGEADERDYIKNQNK